jgi:hypothetical protein
MYHPPMAQAVPLPPVAFERPVAETLNGRRDLRDMRLTQC